jgi:hypothetical protein
MKIIIFVCLLCKWRNPDVGFGTSCGCAKSSS